MIQLDKRSVVDKIKKYSEVVKQNFPLKQIILFGSYAGGKQRENSDIDVAVILMREVDDVLATEIKLCSSRNNIEAMIQPILIEEENDPGGFLEEILRTGEIIYNAEETEVFS